MRMREDGRVPEAGWQSSAEIRGIGRSAARSGSCKGDRRRSEDGLRARLRRRDSGAGSGELLQRGKRMWVDAGTVEPHGRDRV